MPVGRVVLPIGLLVIGVGAIAYYVGAAQIYGWIVPGTVIRAAVALTYLAAGTLAWLRRPEYLTGRVMVLTAFLVLLPPAAAIQRERRHLRHRERLRRHLRGGAGLPVADISVRPSRLESPGWPPGR